MSLIALLEYAPPLSWGDVYVAFMVAIIDVTLEVGLKQYLVTFKNK